MRPEAIEAIFYMWRATHDVKYRSTVWLYHIITSLWVILLQNLKGIYHALLLPSVDDVIWHQTSGSFKREMSSL